MYVAVGCPFKGSASDALTPPVAASPSHPHPPWRSRPWLLVDARAACRQETLACGSPPLSPHLRSSPAASLLLCTLSFSCGKLTILREERSLSSSMRWKLDPLPPHPTPLSPIVLSSITADDGGGPSMLPLVVQIPATRGDGWPQREHGINGRDLAMPAPSPGLPYPPYLACLFLITFLTSFSN